jgi:predicted alpha-1,6-mannanase (GH76 family)
MRKKLRERYVLLLAFGTVVVMILCISAACSDMRPPSDVAASALPSYSQQAAYAVRTLQQWYLPNSGLYQKPTDWWNSANAITALVDYSRVTHTTQYLHVVANTFDRANASYGTKKFINDSNDDEGWWAVAWIDAYDLTKRPDYLTMVQTIVADLTTQWDTATCGGGVWWSKDLQHSAYKNAITNELFLEIAASLANRVNDRERKKYYLEWAQKEWKWFNASGMINSDNMVNDGLNADNPKACINNRQTTWTYNQGVILGGLTELYNADHDSALLPKADLIAHAAMTHLVTPAGILEDASLHGPDVPQFKGIFMRNLARLHRVSPHAQYRTFADTNARSIWSKDQGPGYKFGAFWQGPFDSGDATRQTAALDALLAAAEMQ